ncbi:UTRA domain-containing protein [Streptomyces parvulus]
MSWGVLSGRVTCDEEPPGRHPWGFVASGQCALPDQARCPGDPIHAGPRHRLERVPIGQEVRACCQATPTLASLFECEVGERLLARHFVFHDNETPTQMSTSYVRWSDVEGTPVSDPINEPWPGGTRAQMASLGIRVTRITESFTSGMPTEDEAKTLRIGNGVPVLRYTRRHIADNGRIVEVAHPIVRRGDTTVVDFVIDLQA